MDKLRVITYSSYLTRCPDGVKFTLAMVGIVFALQLFNTIPLTRIAMLHLYEWVDLHLHLIIYFPPVKLPIIVWSTHWYKCTLSECPWKSWTKGVLWPTWVHSQVCTPRKLHSQQPRARDPTTCPDNDVQYTQCRWDICLISSPPLRTSFGSQNTRFSHEYILLLFSLFLLHENGLQFFRKHHD